MLSRSSLFVGFSMLLALVLVASAGMSPVDAEVTIAETEDYQLQMDVHTAGRVQLIDNDEGDELNDNFQHALGNIGFRFQTGDYAEMYFEATQASRAHNEKWWGHEGYVIGRYFPEGSGLVALNPIMETVDIKAGHMVLDFGEAVHRRSQNARTQTNPLIGNSVVSPHATEAGLEVIHQADQYKVVAGVSAGNPTDDFSRFANPAFHGKLQMYLTEELSLSGSYFSVSHDDGDDTGDNASSAKSNLFATDRLGEAYADVDLGSDGQIQPGEGVDFSAWQIDLSYVPNDRMAFHGFYGQIDEDAVTGWSNGRGTVNPGGAEWDYYSLEGSYKFAPAWQAAARYSVADADEVDGDSSEDGEIERIQVGVNTWMTENMMMKLEYVDQEADDFPTAFSGGFDGFISEVSYSF